ncbi:MAG TPA: FecR domain-containing protein [Nannocystaceae bacterium]|nr:FecR domain-containing protein [Nannocystaceae bacterium]
MTDLESAIDLDRLDHWHPAQAPSGFAERVVERWAEERQSVHVDRPAPRRRIVGWMLAIAGALLLAWMIGRSGEPVQGSLVVASRETITLGERATVVAEPGAELTWRIEPDGRATIEQRAGRAFYRVDEGGAFEVSTPAGVIRVTGTCFMVEVSEMRGRTGVIAGATLAAGLVVGVYEGGVVVAHQGIEIAARPGERVVSDSERGLRRIVPDAERGDASDGATVSAARGPSRELDELRTSDANARAEIDRLRAQVEALGGHPDESSPQSRVHRCATSLPGAPGCPVLATDAETLREMARCGSLRADPPPFLMRPDASARPSQAWIDDAAMTDAEVEALTEAGELLRREHFAALADLYADAGGASALDEAMEPWVLDSMITALLDPEEVEAAQRRLAHERAGLHPPADPSALSLEDRLTRQLYDVGDRYERSIANVIGSERAHALRTIDDGWGAAWGSIGTCVDE